MEGSRRSTSSGTTPDTAEEPQQLLTRFTATQMSHSVSPSPETDNVEMTLREGQDDDYGSGIWGDYSVSNRSSPSLIARFQTNAESRQNFNLADCVSYPPHDSAAAGPERQEIQRLSASTLRNSLQTSRGVLPANTNRGSGACTVVSASAVAEAAVAHPQLPLSETPAAPNTETDTMEPFTNFTAELQRELNRASSAQSSTQHRRYFNVTAENGFAVPHEGSARVGVSFSPPPSSDTLGDAEASSVVVRTTLFNEEQLQRSFAGAIHSPNTEVRGGAAVSPAGGRRRIQDEVGSWSVLVRGARLATAEERRVRHLFHNRPRLQLAEQPQVVSNIVLDRTGWVQPLCYPPLWLPCMQNAFYSVPRSAVLQTTSKPVVSNPFSLNVAYPGSARSVGSYVDPRHGFGVSAAVALSESHTLLPSPAIYHVPPTSSRLAMQSGEALGANAAAATAAATGNPLWRTTALAAAREGHLFAGRSGAVLSAPSFEQNCRHFLYRCFCVRCAIASQAQSLQVDMKMRAALPNKFPCCPCLHVESRSYSQLFWMVCLLDALSFGAPCGCCCYQGLGTALYGFHLRYLLRARYRIFAWTILDLLIMCCIPGLAVDQHGAELLLDGVPEAPIGLDFMY
ncbi:hypothetical protein ABL78_6956 [Leptomonas seymouri]|uniref:Uncharacterized protein n=1 Tax=Leptomonas seymouri TaxID=5684 RepID=A0A0N0P3D5_LEPSE|nr:hypothetical protein ABL78_6956 [Leptomonas seymouri]|eukprot:KPI83999.1 hypothetical protein ABL78_6956 [Leptomonas seymouri]